MLYWVVLMCRYPGWNPEFHSEFLRITKESYESTLNVTPRIYSIHAGLECGLIKNKYPEVQFVSVGPTIENAHTYVIWWC